MADLTGSTVGSSYSGLLKTTDNGAIDSSLKIITDALGNESSVKLSTTSMQVTSITYDAANFEKVIIDNVGDWNMDSTSDITYAHGISSALGKILSVTCTIRDDADSVERDLTSATTAGVVNGQITWDDTNVYLVRVAGGTFDATTYNSTSFNRGRLRIVYTTNAAY